MSFTRTDELVAGHEYPMTTEELIAAHGEETLELPNGTERLDEVLGRLASETFESPEDARYAIYSAVSRKAIGRFQYSDRDPTPLGSPYGPDVVSF